MALLLIDEVLAELLFLVREGVLFFVLAEVFFLTDEEALLEAVLFFAIFLLPFETVLLLAPPELLFADVPGLLAGFFEATPLPSVVALFFSVVLFLAVAPLEAALLLATEALLFAIPLFLAAVVFETGLLLVVPFLAPATALLEVVFLPIAPELVVVLALFLDEEAALLEAASFLAPPP